MSMNHRAQVGADRAVGKTTLCDMLLSYLVEEPRGLKVAVLSLDGE